MAWGVGEFLSQGYGDSLEEEELKKTITIHVTKEDIKQGKPFEPRYCPIALATKRAANHQKVLVSTSTIRLQGILHDIMYELPIEATDFIHRFDAGEAVSPILFEAIIN